MTSKPEAVEVAGRWVRKAENDYSNAANTVQMGTDCPFDTICFHAQQCAEKYLKALLIMHLVHFPKIHDLEELAKLLPEGLDIGADIDQLRILSNSGVAGRYPDTGEEPGRPEAEKALSIAVKIRERIRRLLPAAVIQPN